MPDLTNHNSSLDLVLKLKTGLSALLPGTNPKTVVQKPNCHILNLPLEMILSIAQFLPPRSITCLSLTCKCLYYGNMLQKLWVRGFGPKEAHCGCKNVSDSCCPGMNVKNHEPILFLELLEKDLPRYSLCEYCRKLHHRRNTVSYWWLRNPCPEKQTPIAWLPSKIGRFDLAMEDLQQVMQRYEWGELHSKPLESITIHNDWKPRRIHIVNKLSLSWMNKLDVEPRVFKGMLMLRSCQRVLFSRNQFESLDRITALRFINDRRHKLSWLICFDLGVCGTSGLHETGPWMTRHEILKLATNLDAKPKSSGSSVRSSRVFKCRFCATQYRFNIWNHNERGVEVALDTWMNLGSCRRSYSPGYLAATGNLINDYSLADRARIISKSQKRARLAGYVSDLYPDWIGSPLKTSEIDHPSLQVRSYSQSLSLWLGKKLG